jgi:fluoroacetyl-CoA thioesterase
MFENIKIGLQNKEEMCVSNNDTASVYGSGLLEVYATPAMIAFMEHTAMNCTKELLPIGFSTVGTHVNVSHKKATPVGLKVFCEAKLIEVEGRKLVFEMKASDEEGEIGSGTHTRFIIEEKKFIAKLDK